MSKLHWDRQSLFVPLRPARERSRSPARHRPTGRTGPTAVAKILLSSLRTNACWVQTFAPWHQPDQEGGLAPQDKPRPLYPSGPSVDPPVVPVVFLGSRTCSRRFAMPSSRAAYLPWIQESQERKMPPRNSRLCLGHRPHRLLQLETFRVKKPFAIETPEPRGARGGGGHTRQTTSARLCFSPPQLSLRRHVCLAEVLLLSEVQPRKQVSASLPEREANPDRN